MSDMPGDTDVDDKDDATDHRTEQESEENDLEKPEFKNWIRGIKGLEYLKQGLAPFVDREFAIKHINLVQSLKAKPDAQAHCNCTHDNILPYHAGGPCNRQKSRDCICSRNRNRRKCPDGICSKIFDFIVQEHRFTSPSFRNSDMSEWSTNAWSIAKCYLPDTKCSNDSAMLTDASGLLNIMINASFFQQKFECVIDPPNDILSRARDYRNELCHKASQELTEEQLHCYLDNFISVLQDPNTLIADSDAISAVKKLTLLKNNQIRIEKEEIKAIAERVKEDLLEKMHKYELDANTLSGVMSKTERNEKAIIDLASLIKQNKNDIEKLKKEDASDRSNNPLTENDNIEAQSGENNKEDAIPVLLTDNDVRKDVEDTSLDLREYQMELAQKGREGKNVIIVSPTNTGKTRVACKIIQDHIRSKTAMGDAAKVIFVVNTEPLAFQQGQQCAKHLPYYTTKVITGRVQREKKHYLKDYIHRRDILVVTSQVLLNSLKLKEISSIKEFSLIVVDECHHTKGYYSYNQVMGVYLDMKIWNNVGLPQIVGLTASLGVGGSIGEASVKKHMKDIMANLDAHILSITRDNYEQQCEFANKAKEYKVVSKKRSNDRYREAIVIIMNKIDLYMANHDSLTRDEESIKDCCRVPLDKGSEKFIQWISSFQDKIVKLQNDRVIRMLRPCCHHLEVYNKALMMHTDARICDSLAVLEDSIETGSETNETDRMLANLYTSLKAENFKDEPENPKLKKLETILLQHMRTEESRCIVFTKTVDLARAITKWINENDYLRKLNAQELFGRKSMSRISQIDVLEYFKNGRHKIIVATSVAEEGLDVTSCNLVIRYENVKNEIVRLQSRGRARTKDSCYYVLTEEGSNLIQREEELEVREQIMEHVMQDLRDCIETNQQQWVLELDAIQREKLETERRREEEKMANLTPGVKHVHCFTCDAFLYLSTDIRKFHGHHILIADDVVKRVIFVRDEKPKFEVEKFKSDGKVLCLNCQYSFGGVLEFMNTEFPMLKIKKNKKSMKVVDKVLNKSYLFKAWKEINFVVNPISDKELEHVIKCRDEYIY